MNGDKSTSTSTRTTSSSSTRYRTRTSTSTTYTLYCIICGETCDTVVPITVYDLFAQMMSPSNVPSSRILYST